MREIFTEIWESVRRNTLRTCLTGLAVSWGIFLLIVLLGAGNGVMKATMGNMEGISSNVMELWPGSTSKPYGGYREGRRIKFTDNDIAFTESDAFSDVIDEVSPLAYVGSQIMNSGKNQFDVYLVGATSLYNSIRKMEILAGRFINDKDELEHRKCIVINNLQARTILKGNENYESLLGRMVKINGIQYKVVGVRKAFENQWDNEVFIPFGTISAIYSRNGEIDELMYSFHGLNTEQENEAFEKYYNTVFNMVHGAAPDDESTIWIRNLFTQNMQMNKGMNILQTALWILGILTLLGGIVGVSNIMLITVKERTHEFGIRKALGASPASIIKLIIAESIAITAIFGYLGMVLGLVACEVMKATVGSSSMDLFGEKIQIMVNPTVGIGTAVGVTLVLIIAGTVAGLFPARKAAKVKPIEALMSVK